MTNIKFVVYKREETGPDWYLEVYNLVDGEWEFDPELGGTLAFSSLEELLLYVKLNGLVV